MKEMQVTEQTFHYEWCWKQAASVPAQGNFHKNEVIFYWSHRQNLLLLCFFSKVGLGYMKVALVDTQCVAPGQTNRSKTAKHGVKHKTVQQQWVIGIIKLLSSFYIFQMTSCLINKNSHVVPVIQPHRVFPLMLFSSLTPESVFDI